MKSSLIRFLVLMSLLCAAATAIGATGVLPLLPPFSVPTIAASLTIALCLGATRDTWLRAAYLQLGLRTLIALHLGRFVGFYFHWLYGQGRLPAEFAHLAGTGDIIAAAGALGLLMLPNGPLLRRALPVWNVVGLLDLVIAVGTGSLLNIVRPGSMAEVSHLPLTYVPLWLVPFLISTHVFLLRTSTVETLLSNTRKADDPRPRLA